MWNTLYQRLERSATWPVLALLFTLSLLCTIGFESRRTALWYQTRELDARRGFQTLPLDTRFFYSPDQARDFFEAIGRRGRNIYAATEISLDVLFPLVYGSLLSILIIRLYTDKTARRLIAVPVFAAAADVLENITAAYLSWQFTGQESSIAWAATTFTLLKWVLLVLSLLLVLTGAFRGMRRSNKQAS